MNAVIIGQGGNGGGSGSNASVGPTGVTAPISATEIGIIVGGNLVGVSSSNPIPVSGAGGTQYTDGTAESAGAFQITAAGLYNGTDVVGLRGDASDNLYVNLHTAIPAGSNLIGQVEITDGTNILGTSSHPVRIDPTGTTIQPAEVYQGASVVGSGNPLYVQGTVSIGSGPYTVVGDAASGSPVAGNPVLVAGSDGTDARTVLTSNTGQVHTLSDTGSTTAVTQATASNLNAAVIGTKTNNNAAPGATNVGTLPAVANAATQSWTEGDQVALSTDLNGGLRSMSANIPESTAAWTSATSANSAVTLTVTGYGTVVVTLNQGSTLTGGVVTFEVSDTTAFTNAYAIKGEYLSTTAPAAQYFVNTYTFVASTNVSFTFNVQGWAAFRVRLSTVISGSGTVNVGVAASAGVAGCSTVQVVSNLVNNTILSGNGAAAVADNLANVNFLPSSSAISNPLDVADSVYGGAFSGTANTALQGWSKARTATVFKTVQATASGNTAVWTPGSGNKFRLLKVFVELTDNASLSSAGVLTISFQDGTSAMPIAFDVFVPGTAVTTVIGDGLEQELDLGSFGILSATANNVLNVNLSTALTTGNVRVIVMGTEE
jgi:hypothetical protein